MLSTPDIAPRDNLLARQELTQLTQITQKTSASGGKVLFIADRHLLTFVMIKGVPLVPEYELEELTEMSNSGNSNYLSNFRSDLAAKKFQLIVINTVTTDIQGNKHSFANENNAWRNGIVVPLLLYYQPVLSLSQSHLEVYQPIP
jgi:hypothetical protein